MLRQFHTWLKKQSLIFKLGVSVLICVFLAILGVLFFMTERFEPVIRSQIVELADKSVQATVANIAHLAVETEQAVLNMKNTLYQLSNKDENSLQIVLHSALETICNSRRDISDIWVYVFPPDKVASGKLYIGSDYNGAFNLRKEKINDFYELHPWFKEVPKEEKVFWSEPYIDLNNPKHPIVVTCLIPFKFFGQKDYNGLVAVSLDISNMQKKVDDFHFYGNAKLLLVSQNGTYIVHPNPAVRFKTTIFELAQKISRPELEAAAKNLYAGKKGNASIPYSSVFDKASIFFYAPVPHLKWGAFLVYSEKELFKQVTEFQIMVVVSLIVSMLLLLFLINRICHYSAKPLLQLSKIAAEYGKGKFSDSLPEINSSDEIGQLTIAFRNMKKNLLHYIEREKQEISEQQKNLSELEIARNIQMSALPVDFPNNKSFQIAALMKPAKSVGGDFYDFFFIDEYHFAVVIADVSGKGIPAALYMMKTQALIRNMLKAENSLSSTFEHANNELCEGNETCMFVSAFAADIDIRNGNMEYVNAGHTLPFIGNAWNWKQLKTRPNLVLGAKKSVSYQSEQIKLFAGNSIFLYTDGVTEAENLQGRFYGDSRLQKVLQKMNVAPNNVIKSIISDIKKFTKGTNQSDDITMLEFLYCGSEKNEIVVKAELSELNNVMNFVKEYTVRRGVNLDIQSKMIVIAEEIFSNIAQYAYKKAGEVKIEIMTEENLNLLRFTDSGRKYNPLNKEEPDILLPLKERSLGGLGIFIAKKTADYANYVYEDGKNILTMGILTKNRKMLANNRF